MIFISIEQLSLIHILGVETLGKEKLQDNQDGERFELVSYKSNTYIPLKYESEGIRKIISVLGLLISVYNRKSITVAIDELDSGIFCLLYTSSGATS